MKKFLLSFALLMSMLPVSAVNWQVVETDIPNLDLYIDTDSIVYINNMECYYAIKYRAENEPEKVAYLKSNSKTNYIGIIQASDFDTEKYNPNIVFKNAHVFMKPIKQGSFLNYVHNYSIAYINSQNIVQEKTNILRGNNIQPVSYLLSDKTSEYVAQTGNDINLNWNPPTSGRNTQAIVIVTIGIDGSLQNFKFAKSTGDETADRAIISAIEKTAPFKIFPRSANDTSPANFQFVFEHKWFNKSVI